MKKKAASKAGPTVKPSPSAGELDDTQLEKVTGGILVTDAIQKLTKRSEVKDSHDRYTNRR